jgi:ribosomal-protein-alanine N-acetyltransferase
VEISYSVLSQYRIQGYATEAVARLIVWAFSHQNVRMVAANTLPHLQQSIRVLEKNGFSFQGPGSEQGVVKYALEKYPGH